MVKYYITTDLSKYTTLSDIQYCEAQAELVGNFAELYSKAKDGYNLSNKQKKAILNSAKILSNSGLNSEAIQWVIEKFD